MKRGLIARARDDAGQCRRKRSGPRPLRIGQVEHDEIGRATEHLCSRREAADKGDILGAFEKIARWIVARMDQKVRAGDALREGAGRRAAVRLRRRHKRAKRRRGTPRRSLSVSTSRPSNSSTPEP